MVRGGGASDERDFYHLKSQMSSDVKEGKQLFQKCSSRLLKKGNRETKVLWARLLPELSEPW
jgi:hypothetical protein